MKFTRLILLSIAVIIFSAGAVYAEDPYYNYSYNFWSHRTLSAPQAYLPSKVIRGSDLGVGDLNEPMDIFVSDKNMVYILDSGNNRVIVADNKWNVVKIIDKFDNKGAADGFDNPQGLYVTDNGELYVADTKHQRIVHFDSEGKFLRELGAPVSDIIPKDFIYQPVKVAVDKAKRIYVIAQGVNKGVIELNSDGSFMGYMGAPKVSPNMLDYFWKSISTEAQRLRMELFVPTEYNNVTIDKNGFIYVTTSTLKHDDIANAVLGKDKEKGTPVRKLNPTGTDVLRMLGHFPPVGDLNIAFTETSQFVDVKVQDQGIYSTLDTLRGKVFTYDSDSNLLYVFGGSGNREGNFRGAAALDMLNDQFVVLDSILGQITLFDTTDYGRLVNEAVIAYIQGNYDESSSKWNDVLKYNDNSDLAYIGIGRANMRKGNYAAAMKDFKLGDNNTYYSKAFQMFRKQVIGDHFGLIAAALLVCIACLVILKRRKAKRGVEL